MEQPTRVRRTRRSIICGLASAGLLAFSMAPASPASGSPTSIQQTEASLPPPTGLGKASAGVLNVAPKAGQVSIGFTSGIAVAQFRNSLAEAQSQTVDLGILGTAIYGESACESSLPDVPLPESQRVDTPTRVDSNDGPARAVDERGDVGIEGFGAGRQEVEVRPTPYATAKSTPAGVGIPGLVELGAGTAIANAGIVDGAVREATASSQVSVTLAGLVELSGMRWEATHRTGATEERTGRFDLGHVVVAGQTIALPSNADGAEDVINQLLTFSGLRVSLPRVETLSEPSDLVHVTPLRIQIVDSELLRLAVGEILNQSRTAREQVFGTLAEDCQVAGAVLIADLGLLIAGGNGSMSIELGGADASTGDAPAGRSLPSPVGAPTPAGEPDAPAQTITEVAAPSVAATPAPGGPSGPAAVVAPASPISYTDHCRSTHGFEWPACSRGTLLPVALAGLLGTGVMVVLDWRRLRTRRAPRGGLQP